MINVTKTFLPPQEEFHAILKRVWHTGWVTNRGVLVNELEAQLKTYLEAPYLTLTTNGTLPLQIALKALGLDGEVITTPFSYIATSSSICWEGCTPVFVDIHPEYLTIDETQIEAAITSKTSAILATHVFGNPCHVDAIQAIAHKYNLKVIYDAAHGFGVHYNGQSIFNYGDVSTCSFHATKLFHTGEGGCWVTGDAQLQERLYYHHNFGHKDEESYHGLGINAKMSELQAAMGLAVFPYLDVILEARKQIVAHYDVMLGNTAIKTLKIREEVQWNYSYYPVIFDSERQLLTVKKELNNIDIYPRRYFYPSLNTISYLEGGSMPVSESIAKRILCLPLFYGLKQKDIVRIVKFILQSI